MKAIEMSVIELTIIQAEIKERMCMAPSETAKIKLKEKLAIIKGAFNEIIYSIE